jgi:hypothetical protein
MLIEMIFKRTFLLAIKGGTFLAAAAGSIVSSIRTTGFDNKYTFIFFCVQGLFVIPVRIWISIIGKREPKSLGGSRFSR